MKNKAIVRLAATLALPMMIGAVAYGQTLPQVRDSKQDTVGTIYFVKNTSGLALRCNFRVNDGAWSRQYDFPVNYQFTRYAGSSTETLGFACRPPVEQRSYRLRPGQRYVVLKYGNGQIKLVRLTPG